ncbi:UBX domain-containing protein 10 isoform X2 [Tachyglossus aculeatus]|uniref:UBX domain-containing protein 10 isoform X2 n=1 Tax=Tachyglossus aculeatus TaxID=9261 RepID=UPI0018F36981|nr:UBX domain-containing protein 10 isoform X2 [Tachyglossus aculeatus]
MAAKTLLKPAPFEGRAAAGPVEASAGPPHPLAMHVTRPKSAKGRTRTSANYPAGPGARSTPVPPTPPAVVPCEGPGRKQSVGSPAAPPPSQGAPGEILEPLQQPPLRPSSSLNKYRVLPSINRKSPAEGPAATAPRRTGQLQLSPTRELHLQGLRGEETANVTSKGECPRPPAPPPGGKPVIRAGTPSSPEVVSQEEPLGQEAPLLLAVRSPSGQRFVHRFRPTDSLQTVLAVAERENMTSYSRCSVETMEVPRRSFSDLTKSLKECGILHKRS